MASTLISSVVASLGSVPSQLLSNSSSPLSWSPLGVVTTATSLPSTLTANLSSVSDVALSSNAQPTFYLADPVGHCIRQITPVKGSYVTTILAGSGANQFTDGQGTSSSFSLPSGVLYMDSAPEVLFVADRGNHRIRRIVIDTGVVTTIAGSSVGFADGLGTASRFDYPWDITVGPGSPATLYVTDRLHIRVMTIAPVLDFGTTHTLSSNYMVTTLAGSGDIRFNGDGPALAVSLWYPTFMAYCVWSHTLLFSDSHNHRIRAVDLSTRTITTLAGSRSEAFGDGMGTIASFSWPLGLALSLDSKTLFVSDEHNNRVRKIDMASRSVTTFAGSEFEGNTDGTGTDASFARPRGMVSSSGVLYVVDSGRRIRRLIPTPYPPIPPATPPPPPSPPSSPPSLPLPPLPPPLPLQGQHTGTARAMGVAAAMAIVFFAMYGLSRYASNAGAWRRKIKFSHFTLRRFPQLTQTSSTSLAHMDPFSLPTGIPLNVVSPVASPICIEPGSPVAPPCQ